MTLLADAPNEVEHAALLCRGVKSLLRCDEAEVVEGIARYVMSQHAVLRVGSALMERARGTPLPPAAAALGALTRFLEVRPGEEGGGAVSVARLGNERRAIEPLTALLPELEWEELKFRFVPEAEGFSAATRGFFRRWRGTYRLARRLHRRHDFFKVLRAAELVGYYARYLDIFRRGRFRLALMSSHSNPHGIAFNLAARKTGVPVVLVTHGMPVRPVARLSYELSVVHCEAARRTYVEEGCRLGRVFVHGRRQDYAPMPDEAAPAGRLSVGIFLCKDVNEARLRALTERLLNDPRVARVIIRPHPKNLWRGLDEWITSRSEARLSRSSSSSVSDDLKATDVVLAGNSSVLVEAVTAGRPAAYVTGIDHSSHDLHSLVARGLIHPFDDTRGLDPDALLRFYRRPGWTDTLRLFANIAEDAATVSARVRDAMLELASSPAASAL